MAETSRGLTLYTAVAKSPGRDVFGSLGCFDRVSPCLLRLLDGLGLQLRHCLGLQLTLGVNRNSRWLRTGSDADDGGLWLGCSGRLFCAGL